MATRRSVGAPSTVDVVVTCTDRKGGSDGAVARIRTVSALPLEERFQAWTRLLDASPASSVPVRSLYKGDHWKVARELPSSAESAGIAVRVWVCSAGYGLISLNSAVKPYSATFSRGHRDSVCTTAVDAQRWWEALSQWHPEGYHGPRSISQLAAVDQTRFLLIAVSPPYLDAIRNDLVQARRAIGPQRLALVCSGKSSDRELDGLLVPADGRLKPAVGGAMQSLNVRLARRALGTYRHWQGDADRLKRLFRRRLDEAPAFPSYDRRRMTDQDIKAFIRSVSTGASAISKTSALRQLRSSGRACEQGRFAALWGVLNKERGTQAS